MNNKKRQILIVILIAVLLVVVSLVGINIKNSVPVSSNISEGMQVTMLGGSTMKDNGDLNAMRICYYNS